MTTDKAIEFLTALMEQHKVDPYMVTKGDVEALQMGIKALEIVDRLKNAECDSDLMIIKADVADMRGDEE